MNHLGNCPFCHADLTEQIKENIYAGHYIIESVCEHCGKDIVFEYSVMVDCEVKEVTEENK